jgi:hypothetical protein
LNLDWRRLKAVVIESDDWGLCAWSADEQAYRVLADTPAFRSPAGRRYAGSTLESAADVRALADSLGEFRGGDGFPPVWQANMVVAAPDYERMRPPLFEGDDVPLIDYPETPSRWARPGAWDAVRAACDPGVWWPELHGLHHIPETAWLTALRRSIADARRAHDQQSAVCAHVEASGEYDPSEPAEARTRRLEGAIARFTRLVGRAPTSFCPPDYRWDEHLEADLARLGVPVLQGKAEQHGARLPMVRRWWLQRAWPGERGARLDMPPRIAFEPRALDHGSGKVGVEAAHRGVHEAWSRGHPAVLSTHRVNYVHLDTEGAAEGRAALRALLARLQQDGAVFLVDDEVRQLLDRSWSVRAIGDRGVLVRYYGVPREPIEFPARAGATRVAVREGRGPEAVQVAVEGELVVARLQVGEYLLEWK